MNPAINLSVSGNAQLARLLASEAVPGDFIRAGGVRILFLANPNKAFCLRDERAIMVDPAFWNSIPNTTGRIAVLFHELAHLQGANCEECADTQAGKLLAANHFEIRDAVTTYCRVSNRDAATPLVDGFGESK